MHPRNGAKPAAIGVVLAVLVVVVAIWLFCVLFPDSGLCRGCGWKPGLPPGPTTTEFLAADDFVGTWERRGKLLPFLGRSDWDGRLLFFNLPRQHVAALLPDGLELAELKSPGQTPQHPLFVIDGTQRDLTFELGDYGAPTHQPAYEEVILLVPFVVGEDSDCQKFHSWVVRMYLDHPVPVSGGVWWGYRKLLGEIYRTATTVRIDDPTTGDPILDATFLDKDPWYTDGRPHIPNYAVMQQILEMPLVGQNTGSPFICSYWMFSFANVQSRASAAELELFAAFDPPIPWSGKLPTVNGGGAQVQQLRWWLSVPFQCNF